MLKDEVQSVQTLDHKHVVKYFEFNENATWAKKSGERVSVAYIVSELVHGGELFDYVANSGPFKESIVRYTHPGLPWLTPAHSLGHPVLPNGASAVF